MTRRFYLLFILILTAVTQLVCGQTTHSYTLLRDQEFTTGPITLTQGSYAVFHTTDGEFIAQLLQDQAPKTVENFIGLATGTKTWQHPITLTQNDKPLYNNTLIYEIVKNVCIRGGDPINKGTGGPGYDLDLENTDMPFDMPGLLATENSGKKASGSRWFVSLSPFPTFQGRFTIFGKIVGGLDVVRDISRKPTKKPTVPLEATLVNSIEIVTIPAGQQTVATFSEEQGRKVITIDKNFTTVEVTPVATPSPMATPDPLTTASATAETSTETTTETAASESATTETTATEQ